MKLSNLKKKTVGLLIGLRDLMAKITRKNSKKTYGYKLKENGEEESLTF